MTEDMIALARRAVACKAWRWMPGMLLIGGDRITENTLAIIHGVLPDLQDPATLGCLLALVREAYREKIVIRIGNGWWEVETDEHDWDNGRDGSLLQGIVAALELHHEQR